MTKLKTSLGFTLIEILVVMAIITILAAVLLPNLIGSSMRAKEGVARAEISQLVTALTNYWSDYGVYPEDDPGTWSSKKLVEALKGGPDKTEYFPFKVKRIINNEYYSPLNEPYYYRENWSKKIKTPEMRNPTFVDIWTKDRKGKEDGINNWD